MLDWLHAHKDLTGVVMGTTFGMGARLFMLRSDYRQYPAYPHGKLIHLALGLIAGALGSVAVPALYNKDYTAITFLALAAQQFREVRNMERSTLTAIDHLELVPRGAAYIEGIAVVFEGRNYLAILTAFLTSLFVIIVGWWSGLLVGIVSLFVVHRFMRGKSITHIADVERVEIKLEGPNLYVGDVYMMNVGLEENREIIKQQGIGFILTPKNDDARVTIANMGQRQAILHDVSTRLGVYRDDGDPALLPIAKLGLRTGKLGLLVLPREKDRDKSYQAVCNVPLLEAAVRKPTEANRKSTEGKPIG
ncbi:YIEGIA family protein [Cohnella silvisoli]|uniref:YIEGIA family protein n=1 Tax=Cohnella silvisoli TaxID=2873699 RepID=A0ABV1KN13_9BACL|nr:YIEGIA family protein [Cohnella silvisoli]MCD9021225.1 YIEGIA family protein [Cohnella silvisoli]